MNSWFCLGVAILGEVIGTSALKATEGFTRLAPSILTIIGYLLAFYFLSLSLREIPVSVANAIWSGLGVVFITLFAWIAYGQRVDTPAAIGMCLIVFGVLVINMFSKMTID